MNIEDILPELFGEKRVYYCQRCLNHGLREKRKNHKNVCIYRHCQCTDCIMVERRRELNSRLQQIESGSEGREGGSEGREGPHVDVDGSKSKGMGQRCTVTKQSGRSNFKERRPNCQRCAQHNVVNRLKGHKRACPFKDCFCPKCQVVVERQKLMADQIKLRRRQKREKHQMLDRQISPLSQESSSDFRDSSICTKCTQQALSYQQLLSVLDPTSAQDPFLTLSAVLQACPHKSEGLPAPDPRLSQLSPQSQKNSDSEVFDPHNILSSLHPFLGNNV